MSLSWCESHRRWAHQCQKSAQRSIFMDRWGNCRFVNVTMVDGRLVAETAQ